MTIKKIFLTSIDKNLVEAWKRNPITFATVTHGDIFSTPADIIVSPANSFGFMDGGIDGIYTKRFGQGMQNAVQDTVKKFPFQEVLVGQAFAVTLNDPDYKVLISAPTMRVPTRIHDPIDIYLATRAAMHLANELHLDSIEFPGMGTGVGGVPADVAASMMHKGIVDAFFPMTFPGSLSEAAGRHYGSLADTIRRIGLNI